VTAARPAYGVCVGGPADMTGEHDTTGRRVQPNTVESGTRLADRYRLEECLKAEDGFTAWRAVDEKLSRYVGVHVLPAADPRAKTVVEAAQAAAMLNDGRFSQVLDASQQDDVIYVVEERLRGTYLGEMLRGGPLSPADAAAITKDVASALAGAHEAGLAHLRLHPDNVLQTETGQVKVFGLAVEAALYGTGSDDPAATDAHDLGAVLYACLTARWPGGADHGLAAAPYENGVICSPRQVRAGVPAALDDIAMRALCEKPPHGALPLRTPAEVTAELSTVRRLKQQPVEMATEMVGAAAPTVIRTLPAGGYGNGGAGYAGGGYGGGGYAPPAPVRRPSRAGRVAGILVAMLVLAGVVLFGVSLVRSALDKGLSDNGPQQGSGAKATSGAAVKVASVTTFDPEPKGNGEENQRLAANVTDGKPDTTWFSKSYNDSSLPPYKPGVGLVLDLGEKHQVKSVDVQLKGSGTTLELRTGGDADSMPGDLDGYAKVASKSDATDKATLAPPNVLNTRFLLIWLTKLPPDDGGKYRAEIAEITVRG
jgi:hypothetical protein